MQRMANKGTALSNYLVFFLLIEKVVKSIKTREIPNYRNCIPMSCWTGTPFSQYVSPIMNKEARCPLLQEFQHNL